MNAIQLGMKGLVAKLKAIYGSKDEKGPPVPPRRKGEMYYGGGGKPLVLSPAAFDNLFGSAGKKRTQKPMKK